MKDDSRQSPSTQAGTPQTDKPSIKSVADMAEMFRKFYVATEKADSRQRTSCWEFMMCGRDKDSQCITARQSAGRRCWLVAGTLNGTHPSCVNVPNVSSCKNCTFYKKIKSNEI